MEYRFVFLERERSLCVSWLRERLEVVFGYRERNRVLLYILGWLEIGYMLVLVI